MPTISEAFATAVQHHRAGRLADAEPIYRQILAVDPNHPGALHLLGIIVRDADRSQSALEYLERAAGMIGANASVHNDLGGAYLALRRFADAVACFQRALALSPDWPDLHNNLGLAWSELRQPDLAIDCFQRALELNPENPAANNNLGILLKNRGEPENAIACYQRTLHVQPDFVQAHNNLANALHDLGRLDEAVSSCRRAIQINANFVDAHVTLGNVLKEQGKLEEAIASYERALKLNPQIPAAHNNLGNALKDQGNLDEAIACYRRAMQLRPENATYHSNLVYTLNFHPGYDARAIYEEHCEWNRRHAEPLARLIEPHSNDRSGDRRLRIGYVSPDFRSHSVGCFLLPILESHDRDRFEIFCYSSVRKPDAVTERFRAHADVWRDVRGQSDEAVAGCIRRDKIDILIDLTMHMLNNRLLVFARKPAPVQATYLAYCGTTGLGAMDYRLTDPYLDPPAGDVSCYSEQSIRLPETYWCYRPTEQTPATSSLPAMSAHYVTFGCLNNFCKVTAPTLAAWARLLQAVPQSRLLVHSRAGSHRGRVRDLFAGEHVSPERITFADWTPGRDYFRLYEQIDVALDPFPHGGGTTTCDALWMGVPVVSLAGQTAVSRSGLSILSNLGLADLVAFDEAHYEQIAAGLAGDLPRLADLRATLRERMQKSPLMDVPRFTRNIEAAYRDMWQRWCARLPAPTFG